LDFQGFLITSKASDARRRGETTEAYAAMRGKEERAPAHPGQEGNTADDDPAKAGLVLDGESGSAFCLDRPLQ
jgi:hypothetical protein